MYFCNLGVTKQRQKKTIMKLKRLIILSCILFISSHIFGQAVISSGSTASSKFRAAVVKIDITPDEPQMLAGYPERKSNGVHGSYISPDYRT